jgi:hypothetical protein
VPAAGAVPPYSLAGFLDSPEGPGPRFYKRKPPLQVLLLALQRKTPFRPCGYRATIPRLAKSLPAFEVKWTTSGVPGILEEVAGKEPS